VLGFAAIGLFLFWLAYRYEFLYVYNVPYDTKGLMYARALQQLFVGLYLAELCLIGLFSIATSASRIALGPLVMMIIFLVFTVIVHVSLNQALDPLLKYLPKTLETEEQRLLAAELEDEQQNKEAHEERESVQVTRGLLNSEDHENQGQIDGTINYRNIIERTNLDRFIPAYGRMDAGIDRVEQAMPGLMHWQKKHENAKENPSIIAKWFRPTVYEDYYTLRKLVPRDFATIDYDDKIEAETYFHPAVKSLPPVLWVPKDVMGVSAKECRETSKVIPMSDEGAHLDQKNGIVWDKDRALEVPIASEKIYW
jgi:hypothetical protein